MSIGKTIVNIENCIFITLIVLVAGCQGSDEYMGLSPEDSINTLEIHPEFEIEQVASEPIVSDPTDMVIDEKGRMFVLEMHGYPEDKSGTDRIIRVSDPNGDGQMEESTVFADSLVLPMGIMRWKDGLLVADSPNILYLEDTNGDGRTDVKQKVLTGFHESDPESDVNNPKFGLDNWVYLANGPKSDSDIYYPNQSNEPRIPQEVSNRNVKFKPDRRKLGAQSSRTQFGFTFDTWGHQLLVNNRDHIYQEAIASRYLERNPDLLVSDATESISDHGSAAEVFPITSNPNYQLLTDLGEITAACGIIVYQGGAFPPGFENVSFVAEPAHNLVHADRLKDNGPTLVASRLRENTEFLASTDAWFRPVNMYIGPDGALYVVDYYRRIIEGPEWLSEDILESGNLYDGSEMGRIYRITPNGTDSATWPENLQLDQASSEELVEKLDSSNIWWRRNAQRLLLDRKAEGITPELVQMAQDTTSTTAPGRLHALWTLQGLQSLRPELIRQALQDPVGGVRENAVKLAELHLKDSPTLRNNLLSMQSDPDLGVRYQLLLTLGFVNTPKSSSTRQELLFRDIGNKWMQIAALSAPSSKYTELLDRVIDRFSPSYTSFVRRISSMIGANRGSEIIYRLLQRATTHVSGEQSGWQTPVLEGIAQGLQNRDPIPSDFNAHQNLVVQAFFEHPSSSVRQGALQILEVTGLPEEAQTSMQDALQIAKNQEISGQRRAQALEFLALGDPAPYTPSLKQLIVPSEATNVQVAALRAFSAVPGPTVSEHVLKRWSVMTPKVRDAALSTFLNRPFKTDRIQMLLDAIEAGTVQPASINWPRKVTLMRDIPDTLKTRARSLLARAEKQREQEIEEYVQAVKQKSGNPDQGREVFVRQCATCHQMGDTVDGSNFGPDLMSVRGWKQAEIIANTLNPNKSITRGYDLWKATLRSGETVQGIISSETPNAVTLNNQGSKETTIPRRNIESMDNLNVSVMPSNFDERISPQKMADLISFIRKGN